MLSVRPELLQSTYISDGVKGNKSRLREWSAHHLSVWLLVIKKWTQSWFRCENIAGKQNNFILFGDLIATQSEVPSSMIRDFPRFEARPAFLGNLERSFPLSALSLLGKKKKRLKKIINLHLWFHKLNIIREWFRFAREIKGRSLFCCRARANSSLTHPYIHLSTHPRRCSLRSAEPEMRAVGSRRVGRWA